MSDTPETEPVPAASPLERLRGHAWLSPAQWRRRLLFWTGAVMVGLSAVFFAKAADFAFELFRGVSSHGWWVPLLITPPTFALLCWLTQGAMKATRGSGIPQAIAALEVEDETFRTRLLSLKIAVGKMALTLGALLGGASVGREGPTVHVGAGLLYSLGRRFGFDEPAAAGRFILAGSAAGLAAAFNTPLAGVVFAIEEMSGTFEHRMSGTLLTAVIVAGVVSLGVVGNYAYLPRRFRWAGPGSRCCSPASWAALRAGCSPVSSCPRPRDSAASSGDCAGTTRSCSPVPAGSRSCC